MTTDNKQIDKLSTRLQQYIKEFETDIDLSVNNLKDKSLLVSSIRAKWIRYYFVEKNLLDKLKNAKIQYGKQLVKSMPKTVSAMTICHQPLSVADDDEHMQKLIAEIKNTEQCIDYIDKTFGVLDTFNFQIKNAIDIIRLEST